MLKNLSVPTKLTLSFAAMIAICGAATRSGSVLKVFAPVALKFLVCTSKRVLANKP